MRARFERPEFHHGTFATRAAPVHEDSKDSLGKSALALAADVESGANSTARI
jgi:hypothetical protein